MMKLSRDYNGKPGKLIFHILGLNVHPNFINPFKWLIIFKLEKIFDIFSSEKHLGRIRNINHFTTRVEQECWLQRWHTFGPVL